MAGHGAFSDVMKFKLEQADSYDLENEREDSCNKESESGAQVVTLGSLFAILALMISI